MAPVYVVGVGMTKFYKPNSVKLQYTDLAKQAVKEALADANIPFTLIEQACVGYVYGDSTKGQRAIYEVGLTGIPIYNVNNNCSTGSTALFMAKQFVEGGISDCVLALGFEKMEGGSLDSDVNNPIHPLHNHWGVMKNSHGEVPNIPQNPQMFGNAAKEHMKLYGSNPEHYAKIAYKNHLHSVENERAQFRTHYTLEQVKKSRAIYDPLTLLMCSPTSDGAAAAIVCSERFVKKHGLEAQAVEIIGMAMATDLPSSFEGSCLKMVGFDMTQKAAQAVYKQTGLTPNDVQFIELHDCFASNELFTYEALGLCEIGKGGEIVDRGDNTYGGKWVINPSGGLISKGHPLGATGLAQCAEMCWQLRGLAGKRQVSNAKVGLQQNLGLGGAAFVTMYRLGFPEAFKKRSIQNSNIQPEKTSAKICPVHSAQPAHDRLHVLGQHLQIQPAHGAVPAAELGDLERLKGKLNGIERKRNGMWVVTGFAAAKAIFDNTTRVTSNRAIFEAETPEQAQEYKDALDFFASWMLVHDPPRHTKYRTLLFQFLSSSKVSVMETIIRETVHKLIDLVEPHRKMDLRHDFSEILPVVVTARLLGAPLEDVERLKHYAHVFAEVVGKRMKVGDRLKLSAPVVKDSMDYVKHLFELHGKNPKSENLIRSIALDVEARRAKGIEVNDSDVYANVVLLIFASADTLALALPNMVVNLLDYPKEKELVTHHWDAVKDTALDELLRHSGPGGITTRYAIADIHVRDDIYIQNGDTILLDVHEINRDPSVFPNPNKIDFGREFREHLSFGSGRHMCIGRNLARLEISTALPLIFQRLPKIRLAIDRSQLVKDDSLTVFGWRDVPVVF